ncbi:MAG: glycosyltransferase family 2 protein [Chitinophagales bacterium]|nr:glycosyltransferase family 2 protein [Chitinophagales bacterium]
MSPSNQTIGVVTITYNSGMVIAPFLDSILNQTHKDFILYIIDNVSQDNTIELISQYSDSRIRLLRNDTNVGVAAGNNQGMRLAMEAHLPYLMLLNNDVEFEDTLFEKLLRAMNENLHSLVTCKMMYDSEKEKIWYAGCKWDVKGGYMAPHIGQKEVDEGQYDHLSEVDYAPTCMVMMRREVVEEIGYMDEKYFAYFDDTDYFYRITQHAKHKILYYPFVKFYHKVGGLTKSKSGTVSQFKFGNFHIHLTTRNKVYYLMKQRSVLGYWNVIYFFFRMNLRFLFSGKYHVNFSTWKLLNSAFVEGLKM